MAQSKLVIQIKNWANENYARSYGASCIVECLTDDEIADMFPSLKDAKQFASLQDEQYQTARCDM